MADEVETLAATFVRQLASKAARKLRAQREDKPTAWFGLGMSGLIGWSVAVPTMVGGLLGRWWDRHHPGGHSWTLALLAAGLFIGCANAWRWIVQEDQAMNQAPEDKMREVLAVLAGTVLGIFYFLGLWWTIRRGLLAREPAVWFIGSRLVRTALLLVGWYFIAAGDAGRLLGCIVGFLLARPLVAWLTAGGGP